MLVFAGNAVFLPVQQIIICDDMMVRTRMGTKEGALSQKAIYVSDTILP
jgi:hypothetical protein